MGAGIDRPGLGSPVPLGAPWFQERGNTIRTLMGHSGRAPTQHSDTILERPFAFWTGRQKRTGSVCARFLLPIAGRLMS